MTGKPRKRYLHYIGKRSSDPQARMAQMLDTAERKAEEIDAYQRAAFGETGAERAERLKEEARFSPQAFLEETRGPIPEEPTHDTQSNQSMPQSPEAPAECGISSEPDAEPSEK